MNDPPLNMSCVVVFRWTEDPMDIDDAADEDMSEESGDDEIDLEEVKTSKVSHFFVGRSG
jgi:hypothetical protein